MKIRGLMRSVGLEHVMPPKEHGILLFLRWCRSVLHRHRWIENRSSSYHHIVVEQRCKCGAYRHLPYLGRGGSGSQYGAEWKSGQHPETYIF